MRLAPPTQPKVGVYGAEQRGAHWLGVGALRGPNAGLGQGWQATLALPRDARPRHVCSSSGWQLLELRQPRLMVTLCLPAPVSRPQRAQHAYQPGGPEEHLVAAQTEQHEHHHARMGRPAARTAGALRADPSQRQGRGEGPWYFAGCPGHIPSPSLFCLLTWLTWLAWLAWLTWLADPDDLLIAG